jgi:hypothetical protein
MQTKPYGMNETGTTRCVNAQPGTYGHECGKPAAWIGTTAAGFAACFCSECKEGGFEAKNVVEWSRTPHSELHMAERHARSR